MRRYTDRQLLVNSQYRDSSNLEARIELHRRFSRNAGTLNRWLFERLRLPESARILELGSGTGRFWVENEDRLPAGWRVTVSDLSPGMIDRSKEHLGKLSDRFEFRILDAQELPFEDGAFDAVVANYMLYHVPDRPRALREIARVLRAGGRLHAATNGPGHMKELDEFYRTLDPDHTSFTEPFNLQNGEDQLRGSFDQIELHLYPDSLRVDESGPLIAYILSTLSAASSSEADVARLESQIRGRLQAGPIEISKETGLFVAGWSGGAADRSGAC